LDVDDVALRNAGFKRGADCGGKEGVEDVCDQRAVSEGAGLWAAMTRGGWGTRVKCIVN
jgi:hypothetical protein